MKRPGQQRGASILVAMLIVALAAAAAASLLQKQDLALRQLTTARDYEQAVRQWNEAATMDEAAKAWGLGKRAATAMAVRLRKAGWKLRRFQAGRRRIPPASGAR